MDYITAIRSFSNWKMYNELTPVEIALYFAVLSIANQAYWKPEFYAPSPVLQQLSGIGDKSNLKRIRKALVKKGLLCYRYDPREKRGIYSLNDINALPKGSVSNTRTATPLTPHIINNKYKNKNKEIKEREENARPRGQFQNVYLTDNEFEKLESKYGSLTNETVERMSEYMESTGKSYKNHYATLCTWLYKDTQIPDKPAKSAQNNKGTKYENTMNAIMSFINEED